MELSFPDALRIVLELEGGFSNVPGDRGGPTNYGITQTTYDGWGQRHGKPPGSVAVISRADAEAIYLEDFWTPAGCESMPSPLNVVHFDAAVNHGPKNASVFLVGASWAPDQPAEREAFAYLSLRYYFYNRLVAKDPSQGRFLPGWRNRLDRLRLAVGL